MAYLSLVCLPSRGEDIENKEAIVQELEVGKEAIVQELTTLGKVILYTKDASDFNYFLPPESQALFDSLASP